MPAGDPEEGAALRAVIDLFAHVDRDLDLGGLDVLPAELVPAIRADEAPVLLAVNAVLDLHGDALGAGRRGRGPDAAQADVPEAAVEVPAAEDAGLFSFRPGLGLFLADRHERRIVRAGGP